MEELIALIKETMPTADFDGSSDFVEDGLIDSIDIVELLYAIEEKYDITIDPDDIDPDNFASMETIWNMCRKYLDMK